MRSVFLYLFYSCSSGLPETVEVAVSIYCFYLFAFEKSKAGLGGIPGMQGLSLIAEVGLKRNPLNVVNILHGVLNRAYSHVYNVVLDFVHGNVLFNCSFGGAGDELGHSFTAADYRNA